MFEVLRSFWAPKTTGFENDYEDAADWNPSRGVAAIADGVSTAIFSRAWVQILTSAVVADPPIEFADNGGLTAWLAPHRRAWSEQVDIPKLKWNQVAKLNQCGGAWATLLWLHVEECPKATTETENSSNQDSAEDPAPGHSDDDVARVESLSADDSYNSTSWSMTCHAIGDCNVFVVRDGQLRLSHPMQTSADYGLNPKAVCSMNRGNDGQYSPLTTTIACETGDILFLCTDAIGQWIWLELEEHNGQFDWQGLNDWSDEKWHAEIERLRGALRMRIDDSTLVILRVGTSTPVLTEYFKEADPKLIALSENEIEIVATTEEPDVTDTNDPVEDSSVNTPTDVTESPVMHVETIADSEVASAAPVSNGAIAEPLTEA